jgi:hypothetical protein
MYGMAEAELSWAHLTTGSPVCGMAGQEVNCLKACNRVVGSVIKARKRYGGIANLG